MIEQVLKTNFLVLAEAYAKAKGSTLGAVSYRFYGHALFLEDFKRGKCSVSLRKLDLMLAKIIADWPQETARPRLDPWIEKNLQDEKRRR